MTPRLHCLGLGLIVALGCRVGVANAQSPDPNIPQTRVFAPLANIIGPPPPLAGQLPGKLLPQSYGCGQHHDWYGCGGCRAQNVFVFGSCRRFFGEPCAPGDAGERLFNHGQGGGHGYGSGQALRGCTTGCNR